ncbi:MAG TPA: PAS domain S-box protein [Vicinamibacterales bacterium]|nr:PAS domain S-box protein [Vicinamibacterales bacterium]
MSDDGMLDVAEDIPLLFAGNPLPMWLCDPGSLSILAVNDRAVALYGYSRGEFLRMRVGDLASDQGRHCLRSGRIIDVEVASEPMEVSGRPAILMVIHDVTSRKETERALARSEAQRKALIESAPDPIITIDAAGRVLEFNPAAERAFGYRREAVIGALLVDLVVPADPRERPHGGLAGWRPPILERKRLEMQAVRANGTGFPVEVAVTRLDDGAEQRCVVHLRDISDQTRAEEGLHELNTELEERVRRRTVQLQAVVDELEAFSYSVSHDLRAPLRSIDGFSQALAEDAGTALPEAARRHLDRIRAATQRMSHLIDDLLSLSTVSLARMTREHIDITGLAGAILIELAGHSANRSVHVRIAPGMSASGDPRLVRVALENILTNAWKFTSRREDASIEVGQTLRDATQVFYVRDNGVGFDATYADKLFAPFQRLHDASEFPGTGIGLATVRRIVQRHGGRVWADGQTARGACFYFTLEEAPRTESRKEWAS